MIRLAAPTFSADTLARVQEVLQSGQLVQGQQVKALEERVASIVGTPHAIAVSNGTAALHIALLALGIGPGDCVIVPAYSWISTANVVVLCGAKVEFSDVCPVSGNMTPDSLQATLHQLAQDGRLASVKAIMPVHIFGAMADMAGLSRIAEAYRIPLIEDAACALGAVRDGVRAGAAGVMAGFSFHPRKITTTGEGGMVTTHSDAHAWTLKALRNHGMDPDAPTPSFVMPGFNYRLTEMQGALGVGEAQLLEERLAHRRRLAAHYSAAFAEMGLGTPDASVPDEYAHVYQAYVVRLPKAFQERRPEIIQALREGGVESTIGTWHMPLTAYFSRTFGYKVGDFLGADSIFASALALPLHESIHSDAADKVIANVRAVLERYG